MLSGRLVHMVENHAEQLTNGLIADLKQNPRTSDYHRLSDDEIHRRVFHVYHDLGEWLGTERQSLVEAHYTSLGKLRADESVPLSQVLYALIKTKTHAIEYVRRVGLFDSAVDLYQLQEFRRLVDNFFDMAVYYTALSYERETAAHLTAQATV